MIGQRPSLFTRRTTYEKQLLSADKAIDPSLRPSAPTPPRFRKLTGLIITTILSTVLLISKVNNWTLTDSLYHRVSTERASIQIVVQILSTLFGALQVTAISTLINLATRSRLSKSPATLDGFRLWFNLCIPHVEWTLPLNLFLPLLCFVALSYVPAALWAGAISPVSVVVTQQANITVPQYNNISLIQEYPSEYNTSGPQERNVKGAFAYNVGINLEGPLLFSASTATTIDNSPRQHRKLDNSGFTYIGRSYGVGSSAGLSDDSIIGNPLATAYWYEELGYDVLIDCIYNASALFFLEQDGPEWAWAAEGDLPNSNGIREFSVYTGRSTLSIVAIGVAKPQTDGTKYLGIASGPNYGYLNMTQCSMTYIPTRFNISVSLTTKNITVTPLTKVPEIESTGNLSHVATRQLELISNDQTNLYQSLLGNSFRASIGDYNISMSNHSGSLTEAASTLEGLKNSVTAMLDDILVGYASAQLMVGKDFTNTTVTVQQQAITLGQVQYVYAVLILNTLILLLVVSEAFRTWMWKSLVHFDYMDLRDVMIGSSQGGRDLADTADAIRNLHATVGKDVAPDDKSYRNAKVGRISVTLDKTTSALASTTRSRKRSHEHSGSTFF